LRLEKKQSAFLFDRGIEKTQKVVPKSFQQEKLPEAQSNIPNRSAVRWEKQ